jgi:RNA polymerase sigma-70 factor (ECF subfamily)
MAEESDSALVARARRGEAAAQEAIVRRYLRPAYAVALAIVHNVADAEDLAQEVLAAVLQRLEQCRDPALFARWLLQSVRHRAFNQLRQGRARASLLDGVTRNEKMEADASGVAVRHLLLAGLGQLTPVQREVVLLHDLEGWTHKEIASSLGISEVMSRQHMFVARRALRAHLTNSGRESCHG